MRWDWAMEKASPWATPFDLFSRSITDMRPLKYCWAAGLNVCPVAGKMCIEMIQINECGLTGWDWLLSFGR